MCRRARWPHRRRAHASRRSNPAARPQSRRQAIREDARRSRPPQLLDRPHLDIVGLSDRPRARASSGSEARSEEQAAVDAAGQLEEETILLLRIGSDGLLDCLPIGGCSRLSVRGRNPSRPCRCGARPEVNDLAAVKLANSPKERPPGDEVSRCCPLRRRLEIEFGSQVTPTKTRTCSPRRFRADPHGYRGVAGRCGRPRSSACPQRGRAEMRRKGATRHRGRTLRDSASPSAAPASWQRIP